MRRFNEPVMSWREICICTSIAIVTLCFQMLIFFSVCIIFSAYYKLISTAFCRLNIRGVRGGEVLGPMGREFMGWRDWVGRV